MSTCLGFQQKFGQRVDEHWEAKRKIAEEVLQRATRLSRSRDDAVFSSGAFTSEVQQEEEEKATGKTEASRLFTFKWRSMEECKEPQK